MTLDTLEDLINLVNKHGECVVSYAHITIYDDYLE